MISLDSSQWALLDHAYGSASDTPELLRGLALDLSSAVDSEPWVSIWSSLAHQGDVYSVSFAAVPHIVKIIETAPDRVSFSYFQFPAWVEICRQRLEITVREDLAGDYFKALKKLASLVCAAAAREWDKEFLTIALSAFAVSKGYVLIGEALQELSSETAEKLLESVR